MEKKNVIILTLAVTLALVIGIMIGKGTADYKGMNKGQHRMADGKMMMNDSDMNSMMHNMNKSLEGKTGDAFDKEFLIQMVVHHEGAVDMAKKVLEVSKRQELVKLANDIITAQTSEIKMMNDWKTAWFK